MDELLENSLRRAFMRVERIIRDKMSTTDIAEAEVKSLVNSRPVMSAIKEFFTQGQLSQFMDNVNPLAELEHKRRLSAMGPGGLMRERAGIDVRDVQPSHYGKICPIQTPEGQNVGVVNHLATLGQGLMILDFGGPYFKVESGRILNKIEYLNAFAEEKHVIAQANSPHGKDENSAKNSWGRTVAGWVQPETRAHKLLRTVGLEDRDHHLPGNFLVEKRKG